MIRSSPGGCPEPTKNARYRSHRDFGSGFGTEGWSLYWELLLWALHFPQTPADNVGMHHDAVLHLNAMPVEMIRAIVTKQPLDREYTTK